MLDEAPKIVLIVEDVEEWRQHIAAVVKLVLPDVEVRFAQNANEAQVVLDETRGRVALVLSDLHMTEDGAGNGDVLLAKFMESSEETPPLGFVSGTLVDELKKALVETIPGIPFLDKDAFLPMRNGTLDREILEENIRGLVAQGHSSVPHSDSYLEALRRMKSPEFQPAKLGIFIDRIKAKIGGIWSRYTDVFLEIGEVAEFLKKPDLYDEKNETKKLHDFKNNLSLLINSLHERGAASIVLDELSGLQVYINQVFNRVAEDKKTDIVADTANVCRNFNVFREGRLKFSSDIDVFEVPVDIMQNSGLIVELLQNALSHSADGYVDVKVEKPGRIVVTNLSSKTLNFSVDRNVISGEVKSDSASGSGQGIKMLVEVAKKAGILFSLIQDGETVIAELDYSGSLKCEEKSGDVKGGTVEGAGVEDSPEIQVLGDVVFMCHDGTPQKTFEDLQSSGVDGFKFTNAEGWWNVFERRELFENACLCVVHMTSEFDDVARELKSRYPHLVVLPCSHGDTLRMTILQNKGLMDEICGEESIYWNMIGPKDVDRFVEDEDFGWEIKACLYKTEYSPKAFEALLKVARQMAMERKAKASTPPSTPA